VGRPIVRPRTFDVPWRIRDPFLAIFWTYLTCTALMIAWGITLAISLRVHGVVPSKSDLSELFRSLFTRSPGLDFLLIIQSLLTVGFIFVCILRPWSVPVTHFFIKDQASSDARFAMKLFFACLLASVAIAAAMVGLIKGVSLILGRDPAVFLERYEQGMEQEARLVLSPQMSWLRLVPIVLLGPPIEELLFRGCLYAALRKRFAAWQSNLMSSTVFALSHNYLYGFPNVFLLGLLGAYAYERRRSLSAPILFHMLWNTSCAAFIKPTLWLVLIGILLGLYLWSSSSTENQATR